MGKKTIIAIKESAPYSFARKVYYSLRNWRETKEDLRIYNNLRRFKNTAKTKACFIVGNGPSLRLEDLERIGHLGIPSFASNRIYLAFPKISWRPSYYFISDERLITDYNKEKDIFFGIPSFFPRKYRELVESGEFYNELIYDYRVEGRFSDNAAVGIYAGGSVTTEMIQFAYYMGYKEIYLIGVDFNYTINNPNEDRSYTYQGENNYFIQGYLKKGEVAAIPDVELNLRAFRAAKVVIEKQGRIIKNATRGGKLEVFDRADLDELLTKWEEDRK